MSNTKVLYYSCTGATRRVAGCIAEATSAQLEELTLVKPYTLASAYTLGILHMGSGHLPELKDSVDLTDCDTVYLGAPIWCWSVCPPLRSFLASHDLTGKRVVTFCTHQGNAGDYFAKMRALCPGAEVVDGREFYNVAKCDDAALQAQVDEWLK